MPLHEGEKRPTKSNQINAPSSRKRQFRAGSVELGVLLEGTEPARAAEVAEAVRVAIDSAPFLHGDVRIDASVSIGVAAQVRQLNP